ncbi:MAG: DUF116 domain-containing protein [Holophagaceae bacterium]|nr:DUF116 domain-containing protein [Holophagaceae bacterium]
MQHTPTFFLIFRRGIPLAGIALSVAIVLYYPNLAGWALIGIVAILADFQSTFNIGSLYLAKRSLIVRWDGYWLQSLRPIFQILNLEEQWLISFCAWNNQRITQAFSSKKARSAVVLLPHCIQLLSCKSRVVEDIHSCFGCGKCTIKNAAEATQAYGWDVRVAPRSRAAYNEAKQSNPGIVIAVACPDRLVKGLTKLSDTPSYAIPLSLPHGMCVDTTFDFQQLVSAMSHLVEPAPASKIQHLQIRIVGER